MNEEIRTLIQNFYKEFFNIHDVESAKKYVREDYIQHNPGLGQGRQALMTAFAEKFREHPEFRLEIKWMIVEGDMAAVYLKNVGEDGNTRCRVVDLYRVKDGMLAEHWDVLQEVKY